MCKWLSRIVASFLLFALCVQPALAAYVDVVVVGVQASDAVWGTDTYSSDSRVNVAAVHAGLVSVGGAAVVRKTFVAGENSYTGSTRNGITSIDYAAWGGSYTLSLVNALSSYTSPVASWADVSGGSFIMGDSRAVSANGAVMAVAAGAALWVSSNTGSTWTNVAGVGSDIADLTFGTVTVSEDGSLLVLSASDDLWVSANNGSAWTNVSAGEEFSGFIGTFTVSEDGDVIVLHSSFNERTYMSVDSGTTWENIDTGTTVEGLQLVPFFVSSDAQIILAGDSLSATTTWRTTDGGTTWDDALDGVSHKQVTNYDVRDVSADGQTILLSSADNEATGLFTTLLSTDGGDTWNDVATTTAIAGYATMNVQVSSSGTHLAVKTAGGIFVSTDNGATWFNVTQDTSLDQYSADYFKMYETASGQVGILAGFNDLTQIATIATPAVSSVSATPSSSGASVSWASDAHASSKISFGPTSAYGTTTSEQNTVSRVTSHSVSLSGLASCTQYNYAVTSRTILGAVATSSNSTFTTTGCTSSAAVATTTSSTITTGAGGTLNFSTTTITVPTSFASTTSSATFQASQLNATTFFASVAEPTGVDVVGNYVVTLRALADATTTLSSFDEAITVTMSYQAADVASIDTSTLKIYRYNGSAWSELSSCTVDTGARTVSCTTTQFSDFALFGAAASGDEDEEVVVSSSGGSNPQYVGVPVFNPSGLSEGQIRSVLELLQSFGVDAATLIQATAALRGTSSTSSPVSSSTTQFTRDLELNMTGDDVRALQVYLNTHGFPLATQGPGSPGQETDRFGALTYHALKLFQTANNLPSTGYFGPMTRRVVGR